MLVRYIIRQVTKYQIEIAKRFIQELEIKKKYIRAKGQIKLKADWRFWFYLTFTSSLFKLQKTEQIYWSFVIDIWSPTDVMKHSILILSFSKENKNKKGVG